MTKKRLKYKVCVCDVVMVQIRAGNGIYNPIFFNKTIKRHEGFMQRYINMNKIL